MERLKRSRFNATARDDHGDLLLYNSYSGKLLTIGAEQAGTVRSLLKCSEAPVEFLDSPAADTLRMGGFLVPESTDELLRAKVFHERHTFSPHTFQLILLPTEQCNFRCVYCYESFVRGTMQAGVRRGLKNFIRRRCKKIKALAVSWFGGEPLMAMDVIEELSQAFMTICEQNGVSYCAGITTNGFLLTPEVADQLLSLKVQYYQITLDGTAETHDQLRVLEGSHGPSHAMIWNNLLALKARSDEFHVMLRINVNPDVAKVLDRAIDEIHAAFGSDHRFSLHLHPVSQLGGPRSGTFSTCEDQAIIPLYDLAAGRIPIHGLRESLWPGGSVCYAANPYSFVVGSDGTVYKCTVALADERNQVGRLLPTGRMELNRQRYNLWLTSGEESDGDCQRCFFRPACQGNACPLHRLQTNQRPCPGVKTRIPQVLRMLDRERRLLTARDGGE